MVPLRVKFLRQKKQIVSSCRVGEYMYIVNSRDKTFFSVRKFGKELTLKTAAAGSSSSWYRAPDVNGSRAWSMCWGLS